MGDVLACTTALCTEEQSRVLYLHTLPTLMEHCSTLVINFLPQLNGSSPFVHHGQNYQVNVHGQLHSETHRNVLVQTPNANQLQLNTPPHALCLAFSQQFLTGNTSMLIRHHKCIKCNKDVYIKQQTTD